MQRWGLEDLIPTTELLVSELVTNAVKYSRGDVTLRLVNERALVCEVLDNSAALPRLRQANGDDENGRGLQVVRQLSQRWGARRTPPGTPRCASRPAGVLADTPAAHPGTRPGFAGPVELRSFWTVSVVQVGNSKKSGEG